MSSIIPLDAVALCIQYIIFNVFKKKNLERSKRQQAERIVVTITCVTSNNISRTFFPLHIILIRKYYYYYYIRIIIIMLYNCNNFLSKKSREINQYMHKHTRIYNNLIT